MSLLAAEVGNGVAQGMMLCYVRRTHITSAMRRAPRAMGGVWLPLPFRPCHVPSTTQLKLAASTKWGTPSRLGDISYILQVSLQKHASK